MSVSPALHRQRGKQRHILYIVFLPAQRSAICSQASYDTECRAEPSRAEPSRAGRYSGLMLAPRRGVCINGRQKIHQLYIADGRPARRPRPLRRQLGEKNEVSVSSHRVRDETHGHIREKCGNKESISEEIHSPLFKLRASSKISVRPSIPSASGPSSPVLAHPRPSIPNPRSCGRPEPEVMKLAEFVSSRLPATNLSRRRRKGVP